MAEFNLNLFAKVVRLAESEPHSPSPHNSAERRAAWKKAEELAGAAGYSLEEALSFLDGPAQTASPFDWMEESVARSRKQREGKRRAAARHRAASGSPIWQEHPAERAIREALVGHDVFDQALWSDHLPIEALDAIRHAMPWPSTMREAIAEEKLWDDLEAARQQEDRKYSLDDGPRIRRTMLRDYLCGPAQTTDDMLSRAQWLRTRGQREVLFSSDVEDAVSLLADDIATLAEMLRAHCDGGGAAGDAKRRTPEENKPLTNREKRDRVWAVLKADGGEALSIRELARRAGVSVQGAANMRAAFMREAVNG